MMEFDGEEDALEATFTPVAALTNFGVQANDIKKLKEAGFMTIQAVMMCSRRKLALIKGFSDAKVEKVYDAASKVDSDLLAFHTAADLQARRDSIIVRVTTGCDELNDILGGGIESSSITELYGEFRTGKSQLSLTVAVASFLPREVGGGEGRAMYLDTEGSFRPERLKPIAARFDLDADFVVSNVLYARVYNCDHLDTMLVEAGSIFAEAEATGGPFRTLIVDSIIGVYRQEFIGRGELAERQQRTGCVLQKLEAVQPRTWRGAARPRVLCCRLMRGMLLMTFAAHSNGSSKICESHSCSPPLTARSPLTALRGDVIYHVVYSLRHCVWSTTKERSSIAEGTSDRPRSSYHGTHALRQERPTVSSGVCVSTLTESRVHYAGEKKTRKL